MFYIPGSIYCCVFNERVTGIMGSHVIHHGGHSAFLLLQDVFNLSKDTKVKFKYVISKQHVNISIAHSVISPSTTKTATTISAACNIPSSLYEFLMPTFEEVGAYCLLSVCLSVRRSVD